MCSCWEMIGATDPSAADSARYGTSAQTTIVAAAGYLPASRPCRISERPAGASACRASDSWLWRLAGTGAAGARAGELRRRLPPDSGDQLLAAPHACLPASAPGLGAVQRTLPASVPT